MVRTLVTYRGQPCSVAQEFFATMKDVYVLSGQLPEDAYDRDTADGRSSIKANAARRLGKLVCADELELSQEDVETIADELAKSQMSLLTFAIQQVIARGALKGMVQRVIFSGHGEFLARASLRQIQSELKFEPQTVSLSQELGPIVSRCATAHALAVLARERLS